jgi:hypothetical protein
MIASTPVRLLSLAIVAPVFNAGIRGIVGGMGLNAVGVLEQNNGSESASDGRKADGTAARNGDRLGGTPDTAATLALSLSHLGGRQQREGDAGPTSNQKLEALPSADSALPGCFRWIPGQPPHPQPHPQPVIRLLLTPTSPTPTDP